MSTQEDKIKLQHALAQVDMRQRNLGRLEATMESKEAEQVSRMLGWPMVRLEHALEREMEDGHSEPQPQREIPPKDFFKDGANG